ncbi:MAG: hypothetical protein H7Y30_08960 [Pyrinomonadaceae bacterium]|nr:hypothetical protein [Pyrinomonadaceae bacterium]
MSTTLIPIKTQYDSWVVEMTPEMAQAAHVAEGSYLIFQLSEGKVLAEILPPATPEIKDMVRKISEQFHDDFAEMKRLGD